MGRDRYEPLPASLRKPTSEIVVGRRSTMQSVRRLRTETLSSGSHWQLSDRHTRCEPCYTRGRRAERARRIPRCRALHGLASRPRLAVARARCRAFQSFVSRYQVWDKRRGDGLMQTEYDAVIIGAGPAGSTAAILLAQAGWSVALLEKQVFPRRKVCGECIAASNLPLVDALGIGDAFAAMAGPELRRVALLCGAQSVSAALP